MSSKPGCLDCLKDITRAGTNWCLVRLADGLGGLNPVSLIRKTTKLYWKLRTALSAV